MPFVSSAFVITRAKLSNIRTARRSRAAISSARSRTLVGTRVRQRLADLQPPIIAGVEQEYVRFDFGRLLLGGNGIAEIAFVNCFTDSGPDAAPQTRILNTPSVI